MNAELKVLFVSAAVIAFAYTALYPRLREKTLMRMVVMDLGLSSSLLLVVGLVYFGTQTPFSLIFIEVPWWVFTLLCAVVIEVPFFIRFCKRWNIDLNPPME